MPELKRVRPLLERADVELLLRACGPNRWPSNCRNRALLAVLAYGGLRISEALALRPCDLKLEGDTRGNLMLRSAKSGRDRTVRLAEPAVALVEVWLAKRAELLGAPHKTWPLFGTIKTSGAGWGSQGEKRPAGTVAISQGSIQKLMHRLAERTGLPRDAVHAHGLRHFCSCEMFRANVSVESIRRVLGHANLQVTQLYLQRFGDESTLAAQAATFEEEP